MVDLDDITLPDLTGTAYEGMTAGADFQATWKNLFRKLYGEGIVPEFVDRDAGDAEAWFRYLAISAALDIELARTRLIDMAEDPVLLAAHLRQRSLLVCEDLPLARLQDLRTSSLRVIRDRGTHKVTKELKDYLCADDCTPFFFEYAPRFLAGWTLDRSSPNYLGREHYQMNIAPTLAEDIFASDGLENVGEVSYETDGTGLFALERGDIIGEVADGDNLLELEGGFNLVIDYGPVRNVVILGEGEGETAYILQENLDKILRDDPNPSGLPRGLSQENTLPSEQNGGTQPAIRFTACIWAKFAYEIRFYARVTRDAGVRVNVSSTEGVLWDRDLVGLLSERDLVPATGLPSPGVWYEVRVPLLPRQVFAGEIEPTHRPAGSFDHTRIGGTGTHEITVEIANPYGGALAVHQLSLGPVSVDNFSARLDAYNEATTLYLDRPEVADQRELAGDIRKYLLPYGSTLYTEKINK